MIELLVMGKEGSEKRTKWMLMGLLRKRTDSPMVSWTAGSE